MSDIYYIYRKKSFIDGNMLDRCTCLHKSALSYLTERKSAWVCYCTWILCDTFCDWFIELVSTLNSLAWYLTYLPFCLHSDFRLRHVKSFIEKKNVPVISSFYAQSLPSHVAFCHARHAGEHMEALKCHSNDNFIPVSNYLGTQVRFYSRE